MIQKGIVTNLLLNENRILVRIPFFETAGSDEVIFNCLLLNQPGLINGYQINDVVFVDFENNDLDTPIVIGKLYTGSDNVSKTSVNADNINAEGAANFSSQFTVGEVTYNDLLAWKKQLEVIESSQTFPLCPSTAEGTYILKATVSNDVVTYSWVKEVSE